MSESYSEVRRDTINGEPSIERLLGEGPLDRPITFTFFPGLEPTTRRERRRTLRELRRDLKATKAKSKQDLELFTGAVFGDRRSVAGILRHNANVEALDALVVDYDENKAGGMVITPERAADICEDADIAALIATTPSHGSPEKGNCWRAVFPLSRRRSPAEHAALWTMANHLFRGGLDKGAKGLSQSFYFGHVGTIWTSLVDGRPLDESDELAGHDEPDRPPATAGSKADLDWPDFEAAAMAYPNDDVSFEEWLAVGMAIHHQGDDSPEALELWHRWSERSGKYQPGDLDRRWDSFGHYDGTVVTGRTIVYQARKHGWEDPSRATELARMLALMPDRVDPVTARLNKRYAAVRHAGRTLIAETKADGSFKLGSVDDLHRWHENDPVTAPKGRAQEPASKHWMRDPDRLQFEDGIVFDPSGRAPRTALNLWTGFAVEPKPQASCERILAHVKDVICDGRDKRFRYVIGYLAHMVQRTGEKPDVALVLKGGKGAGKDTLAVVMTKIIGSRHVAHIDNPERLTSRFNSIFATAILGHVEEAFWAGDRGKKGTLQALITAPTMTLELKGVDAISVDSFLRLIMTTNERWSVPASVDERRYAVFDVAGDRMGDHDYFRALYAEIDGDGPAAFLAYLRDVDLSRFDVRDVPQTAALREEKLASLKDVEAWWFDVLMRGELPGDRHGEWSDARVSVPRDALRESYAAFVRDNKYRAESVDERRFGVELRLTAPSLGDRRPRVEGRPGPKHYVVPALSKARLEFEDWLKAPVDWEG